jgi:hypothetical protein
MQQKRARKTLTIISFGLLLAALSPRAHAANCSTATVAGNWGFTLSGTLLTPAGPVPAAAVGRVTVDNRGNGVGVENRNVGGQYADETLIATWTVNSDCTGTLNASIYQNGQLARISVTTVVFDDNSKHFRMVQKSLTLPDGTAVPVVITLEGTKQ